MVVCMYSMCAHFIWSYLSDSLLVVYINKVCGVFSISFMIHKQCDVYGSVWKLLCGKIECHKEGLKFPSCLSFHLHSDMKYVIEISPQFNRNKSSQTLMIGHDMSIKCHFVQICTECLVALFVLVSIKET